MLETDVAEVIAQGQQQIVVIEVARAKERIGLLHELAVRGDLLRLDVETRGRVGDDIEPDDRALCRRSDRIPCLGAGAAVAAGAVPAGTGSSTMVRK